MRVGADHVWPSSSERTKYTGWFAGPLKRRVFGEVWATYER
jgi:hypothetical protein